MNLFKIVFTSKENGSTTVLTVIDSDQESAKASAIGVLKEMGFTYNPELQTMNCYDISMENPEILSVIIA